MNSVSAASFFNSRGTGLEQTSPGLYKTLYVKFCTKSLLSIVAQELNYRYQDWSNRYKKTQEALTPGSL